MKASNDSFSVLKKYWGYSSFRNPQQEIIENTLDKKDVLAILPTGAGKSICFQVPGIILSGVTLVISPLIALMTDQVKQLNKRGINAYFLHSGQQKSEQEIILSKLIAGDSALLYISPEKLASEWFQEKKPFLTINLIAIDEAHCISQWGYDFRPDYLKIPASLLHINCPKIAVTATATPEVQKDIEEKLELRNPSIYKTSIVRKNLAYKVHVSDNNETSFLRVIKQIKGSTIVYVRTRNTCSELSKMCHSIGLKTIIYHAGLTREQRVQAQEAWMNNTSEIIIATNAFGMGIDKPDVRNVIHFGAPDSLESYYQEAGRAGRDGKPSNVLLLSCPKDKLWAFKQLDRTYQPKENVISIFQSICNILQLAEGVFLEGYHPIDFTGLQNRTGLEPLDIHYCLKILDLSGIINYQKDFFTPSKLKVRVTPKTLYEQYHNNKIIERVIKAIIRIYGAIVYEEEITLNEQSIANMAEVSVPKLHEVLSFLKMTKIIYYFKGTDLPIIQFSIARPSIKKIPIKHVLIEFLKKRAFNHIEQMYNYIEGNTCKQEILSNYFGQELKEACGNCSVCKNDKTVNENEILDLFIKGSTLYMSDLKTLVPFKSNKELAKSLEILIQNNQIVKLTDDGFEKV